jgi:hypothetical protein
MDDCHTLRLGNPISKHNLASGGAGSIDHAFEFHAAEDVRQSAVAILRYLAGIKEIVTRGKNDISNLEFENFIFLIEINAFSRAEDLAGFTLAS